MHTEICSNNVYKLRINALNFLEEKAIRNNYIILSSCISNVYANEPNITVTWLYPEQQHFTEIYNIIPFTC